MTQTRLVVGPGQADNKQFGEILEELRTKAEVSRATIASYLELSSEYIRLIERGMRTPAFELMPRILSAFKTEYVLGLRQISFGDYVVEFSSRIQARGRGDTELPITESGPRRSRSEQIGQIVDLLVAADEKTLRQIHSLLLRG